MRVPGAPLLERACLLIEAYRVHWRDTMVRADKSGDDDLYGEAAGPLYDCRAFQGAIDPERFDNAMREHGGQTNDDRFSEQDRIAELLSIHKNTKARFALAEAILLDQQTKKTEDQERKTRGYDAFLRFLSTPGVDDKFIDVAVEV